MSRLERLIRRHYEEQTNESLDALAEGMRGMTTLLVPLSGPPAPGLGLPVICVTTELGGCVPAFTTVERIAGWKPGAQYADIPGKVLVSMASRMPQIAGLYLDMSHTPNSWLPRAKFASILAA